jgi:Protein of unknown function (DUF2934)
MATRQRTRAPRKPSSSNSTSNSTSAAQASGGVSAPTDGAQINTPSSTQESAVLRAAFDTEPFEERDYSASDQTDTPKATFVGEQLVYKDRDQLIAEAAYLRAEQRGFSPGYELDDWLAAEAEINAQFSPDGNSDSK